MKDPLPPALATYIAGLKAHDVEMIGASLADEVQFVTPAKTMDKSMIVEFLAALYRGFPDWNYDHDKPELLEDGSFARGKDSVRGSGEFLRASGDCGCVEVAGLSANVNFLTAITQAGESEG